MEKEITDLKKKKDAEKHRNIIFYACISCETKFYKDIKGKDIKYMHRISAKSFIFCLLAVIVKEAMGSSRLFDSEKVGHLYNIEKRLFLGRGWVYDSAKRYMILTQDSTEALDIKMQNVMGPHGPYLLFLAVNFRTVQGKRRGPKNEFMSLTRHTENRWSDRIGLDGYNDSPGHMFSISVPSFMDTQAFHIFQGAQCLGYNMDNNIVVLEKCVDAKDRNRDSQLWVWVTRERYLKDYKKGLFNKYSSARPYTSIKIMSEEEKREEKEREKEMERKKEKMRMNPFIPGDERDDRYRDYGSDFTNNRHEKRCRGPVAYCYSIY